MAYVGINEAAERLGVSADTVRRRLKSGDLEGKQEPMGSGYRWLVEVPDETDNPTKLPSEPGSSSAETIELAAIRARVEGLEALIDQLANERDRANAQVETLNTANSELRAMLQTSQRIAESAQTLALPPDTQQHGPPRPDDASSPSEGLSGRVRRWIRGGA